MGLLTKRLLTLLDAKERRLSYALLGLVILAGLIDVVGVSSILPFMAVVGNPGLIQTNPWLHNLFVMFKFESTDAFLIGLGAAALVAMVFSNAVSFLTASAILWFSHNVGHSLSTRMLSTYVQQPYAYFLGQNSSNLVVNCTDDVGRVTQGIMVSTLQAIAKTLVAICILLLVVWVDPWLAILFGTVIGGLYGLVFLAIRHRVTRLGKTGKEAQRERYRLATEILGGIKELKILGNDEAYRERFAKHSALFVKNQWMSVAMSLVPRYAIESVAFGSMILLVMYLLATHQDFKEALPLMALYAFAGYRLIPAFQQIFSSVTLIRFQTPSLEAVEEKLGMAARGAVVDTEPRLMNQDIGPVRQEIRLTNVVFQYANATTPLLNNLTLAIQHHMTVGIVGSSGGGKTTIIDIILGLLEPQNGCLFVDGVPITPRNVKSWQKHLGYVPQQIYLADDTLAANIAFGVAPKNRDMERVIEAARIAHVHDFVLAELPDGYDTMVGERGVRLSGGQRQRIGIARALYSNPDVLILDEATSALDNLTEDAVAEAVREISHQKTIIIVAHRLRTVQQADIIYLLENGSIADQGTYEELLGLNEVFRNMAKGVA
ncbi:MAG: ABC transporter ATP-binding protein [Nitrospira sp.]